MTLRRILLPTVIVALLLSCSVPFFAATPVPAAPTPTVEIPAASPTDTPIPPPTETATIEVSATPGVPRVTPIDQNVNCRFGPGTDYEPQGSGLLIGNSAQIVGKNNDGSWWQIQDPSSPGQKCWVGANVTTASGNLAGIPVVPAPAAFVTDLSISVDPSLVSVPSCSFPGPPIGLTWAITTNGPATVKYRLEVLGDSPTETMTFAHFGTQSLTDHHNSGGAEGEFTVKIVVTDPNDMVATDTFKVDCP